MTICSVWPLAVVCGVCALGDAPSAAQATGVQAGSEGAMPLVEAIRLFTTINVRMSPEQSAAAERAITSAEATHGTEASWQFARAMVLRRAGDGKAAREMMDRVVKAEPAVADHQFWLGTLCFETINDAGLFEKMGQSNKGKAAFEKALQLDPAHVPARFALFQFYANAPGIAGGSTAKAKALAEELLALPEGKGEFNGHLCLAQLAAKEESWDEMARQYALAEALPPAGEGTGPLVAIRGHARTLLSIKKDPAAALVQVERGVPLADSTEAQLWFIKGQAHQQLKQMDAAAEAFVKAVDVNPASAPSSLFGLAECLEATGKFKDAAERYAQFAKLFPKDERAGQAGDGVKRCEKKVPSR
ncbi:MAG: tetratricopeptide repeat protein [Phycisphaerales bacterium]